MSAINVLVLCTGNSARSILGEALLNRLGAGRVRAFSAGSNPQGRLHPGAVRLLTREGFELDAFCSKSWNEFTQPDAPPMDVVITVCGNAAGEACPVFPGRAVRVHWGLSDPASVTGSEATQNAEFERTYDLLLRRVEAFIALPFESMTTEALGAELNAIGTLEGAA
jgi:arsenate reductase